jgi:5'-nucleotidase
MRIRNQSQILALAGLLAMLGLVCLGCPSESSSVCDQVTCSGHGTCQDQGGQPVCDCEAGWGAVGTECIVDYDLVLFHTNDRHSNWLGLPNCEYQGTVGDGTVGGAARWMKLVEDARATNDDVLLLDAGDFTMGTLLVAAENNAADLNLMTELGYAAAALGNHEFDWGPQRLAAMIDAADKPLLPLLCANMDFDPNDPSDDSLEALYGPAGQAGKWIHPWIILERPSGVKVGLFGLIGLDASNVSNAAPVSFTITMDDLAAKAQEVTDTLRSQGADLVILLAHVGIGSYGGVGDMGGETVELAKRVAGIDAILSGHNHTRVPQGLEVACEAPGSTWTTVVLEAGSNGQAIGKWSLARAAGVQTVSAELLTIDDSLALDDPTSTAVDGLVADVEANVLGQYPLVPEPGAFLTGDLYQVLTCTTCETVEHHYENSNQGYLLADAVAEVTGADLAVMSNGADLRASLQACSDGCYDLSGVFISTPLGSGPDGLLGYPIVSFYLKWREMKLILEATIPSTGQINDDYMLSLSGMRLQFSTAPELIGTFSQILRIEQYDPQDESDPGTLIYQKGDPNDGWYLNQDELVRVALTHYVATFLGSFNLRPRDENGVAMSPVDWDALIVHDQNGLELKPWYLLASKLVSFGQAGVPDQYCDDVARNPYGPYWRRACDVNAANPSGHVCP